MNVSEELYQEKLNQEREKIFKRAASLKQKYERYKINRKNKVDQDQNESLEENPFFKNVGCIKNAFYRSLNGSILKKTESKDKKGEIKEGEQNEKN